MRGAFALVAALALLLSPCAGAEPPRPPTDAPEGADEGAGAPDSIEAGAEPLEPPPDAPEGADYEAEVPDSIEADAVETDLGATGWVGERPRGRRRVRFRDGAFAGDAREGAADPLAGGVVEGRGARGRWTLGRLGPAWGRGLLLGGAVEPWRPPAPGRLEGGIPRARTGNGVDWRWGTRPGGEGAPGIEALCGRFGGSDLAGARVGAAGLALGALVGGAGRAQTSVGLERERFASELAMDRAGRWRAAAALERAPGPFRLAVHAHGGLAGFRSLAEPRRAGPAQALAMSLVRTGGASAAAGASLPERRPRAQVRLTGALWRFRPGLTGGRAALEVALRMTQHEALAAGFEEQRGVRREPATRADRFRQGVWGEWRAGRGPVGLALREELWGERAWVRGAVRSVSAAGVDLAGPAGLTLRVFHCVYRVRSGESLYLPETDSDRLVLRALTGAGERTRIEARAPLAGGVARAAVSVTASARGVPRAQWTMHWTRRASLRRSG